MNRRASIRTFSCPHCGADVREGALACRECGSDDLTGWSEDTHLDGISLPELDDPAPSDPSEEGSVGVLPIWKVVAVVLLIVVLVGWLVG